MGPTRWLSSLKVEGECIVREGGRQGGEGETERGERKREWGGCIERMPFFQ